jgi:hypothetical protein
MTSKYRIRLSFETIRCTGCSVERIRGVVCPDCGARPDDWEVDPELVRRRSIVAHVLEALSAQPPTGDLSAWPLVEQETFSQLVDLVPVILSGLQQAAKSGGDGAELEAAATRMVELRSTIHRVVHRRPYVALAGVVVPPSTVSRVAAVAASTTREADVIKTPRPLPQLRR